MSARYSGLSLTENYHYICHILEEGIDGALFGTNLNYIPSKLIVFLLSCAVTIFLFYFHNLTHQINIEF